MRMRVDKTRSNGLSAEIDLLGPSTGKIQHVRITADGKKPAARNSHCLRAWFLVIHRQDVSVVQNQIRLLLLQRKKRKRSKCAEKFRSEEHTSELQSRFDLVCRLLLEKKKN